MLVYLALVSPVSDRLLLRGCPIVIQRLVFVIPRVTWHF